jgi:hypothetical protein
MDSELFPECRYHGYVEVEGASASEWIFMINICCQPGCTQALAVMIGQGHRVVASLRDNGQAVRYCVALFKGVVCDTFFNKIINDDFFPR